MAFQGDRGVLRSVTQFPAPGQYRHSHCVQLKPMNLGITRSQWGQAHWNQPPRCLATAAAARGAHKKSVYSSATNPIFFISLVTKELPSLYFIYSILADKCHSCSFFFFFSSYQVFTVTTACCLSFRELAPVWIIARLNIPEVLDFGKRRKINNCDKCYPLEPKSREKMITQYHLFNITRL